MRAKSSANGKTIQNPAPLSIASINGVRSSASHYLRSAPTATLILKKPHPRCAIKHHRTDLWAARSCSLASARQTPTPRPAGCSLRTYGPVHLQGSMSAGCRATLPAGKPRRAGLALDSAGRSNLSPHREEARCGLKCGHMHNNRYKNDGSVKEVLVTFSVLGIKKNVSLLGRDKETKPW